MEILDSKRFREEMIRKYDKDTSNWSAYLSRNKSGFYDWLYSGAGFLWKLKTDSIYSANPIGFGVKIDFDSEKIDLKKLSYGFREISMEQVLELSREDLDPVAEERILRDVVESMKSQPRPTGWITGPMGIEGPIHLSDRETVLGEKQKELDERLEHEVRRSFRSRNPHYG